MNDIVFALTASGSDVYAGGDFTTAGGAPATKIAKWNGSSWSALGSGMNARVWTLALSGSHVFAGGDFASAGSIAANGIAMWNGYDWSALGSGILGSALALTVSNGDLYVGGGFWTAGGKVAVNLAKALVYPLAFDTPAISNGAFQAVLTGPVSNSVVVDGSTTFSNWTPLATNTLTAGGWQLTFPTGMNAQQFYRARFGP